MRPNTTLRFNPGWNVVLGRNATGKTTLLNLLSCILRSDFTPLREERFEIEFEFVSHTGTATVWLRHTPPRDEAAPQPFPGEVRWTLQYRITLRVPGAPPFVVTSDGQSATSQAGNDPACPTPVARIVDVPFVPLTLLATDHAGWSRVIASSEFAYRFDEALETFYAIVGDERAGREPSTSSVATFATTSDTKLHGGARGRSVRAHFFPQWMMSSVPNVTGQGVVTLDEGPGMPSPHLASLPALLEFARMVTTLTLLDSHDEEGRRWFTLGKLAFTFTRVDGTMLRHDRLSFGQKRLLAFFYYLDANPRFVVADELVNGMHHAWIADCVRAMEGRQVFVTAQNPLLLDHLHFERPEDVAHRFVLCQVAQTEGGARETVWEHPTQAQGEEIQRAYDNGVLRVHEILKFERLW